MSTHFDTPLNLDEPCVIEDMARYLKVNPRSLYRQAKQGIVPSLKIGKSVRFIPRLVIQKLGKGCK